jgi:PAS domain S-box-containing protein
MHPAKAPGLRHVWNKFTAHLRRGATAYLVLVVTLIPSGIVYERVRQYVRAQQEQRFRERTEEAAAAVRESFREYAKAVCAVGAFFEASSQVSPSEWSRFITKLGLATNYPGIRSIGYAPVVPTAQSERFKENLLVLFGTNMELAAGSGPLMAPTIYVEQFGGANDKRYGWDSMSDPHRAPFIQQVLNERRPVLSLKNYYRADPEPLQGVSVYLPVAGPPESSISGVVFSSFVPQRMLRNLDQCSGGSDLNVELRHSALEKPFAEIMAGEGLPSKFQDARLVELFGEPFLLRVRSTPLFEAHGQNRLLLFVLCGGGVFSLLLFGIAWTQVRARAAAEGLNKRLLASEEQLLRSNRELERHITEQKATESLLAHERDLLRSLLDYSPDRIYFKDVESRFIKCGKAVIERLGFKDTADAVGKTDANFFTDEHTRAAREMEQQIMRTGQPVIGVVEKETWRDGHESWVLTSKLPLRDKHGNIIGTFGTSKDVTALKRAELALEKEKELLAVTLRSIGDGVITTDTEGRIVLFNKVAEQLTGWTHDDAVNMPLRNVFRTISMERGESDTEIVRRTVKTGEVTAQERGSVLMSRDGDERHIAESIAPIVDQDGGTIGAVLVFRDITEKLKTEAELLRASKIESIGVLAGGIAHDFNNILTVILGNISLARMLNEELPPQIASVLNEAEKASLRARDLTQRLLTFAKGGAPIKKVVALGPLLRDCTKVALQGTDINYQFFFTEDLWPVNADEGQLAQVFQNLVQNARSAVADTPVIDVHGSNMELARDPLMLLIPGRYVRISIRDHGAGLQPEQLNKVFDPYFSPRKPGGGLELATAYSIVRKHGGQIRVESISGQGTVFHVYLPAASTVTEKEAPRQRPEPRGVGGRVLVMDDEDAIRQLASALLRRIGYTAVAVADGAEAITKYDAARRAGQPFDAVVMDLTVPNGMGGADALRELQAMDPGVKAIVCSGYSNDPVMANYREYGFSGVVPKPYNAEDLATALSEMLSTRALSCDALDVG